MNTEKIHLRDEYIMRTIKLYDGKYEGDLDYNENKQLYNEFFSILFLLISENKIFNLKKEMNETNFVIILSKDIHYTLDINMEKTDNDESFVFTFVKNIDDKKNIRLIIKIPCVDFETYVLAYNSAMDAFLEICTEENLQYTTFHSFHRLKADALSLIEYAGLVNGLDIIENTTDGRFYILRALLDAIEKGLLNEINLMKKHFHMQFYDIINIKDHCEFHITNCDKDHLYVKFEKYQIEEKEHTDEKIKIYSIKQAFIIPLSILIDIFNKKKR